jgi:hypothetical protein
MASPSSSFLLTQFKTKGSLPALPEDPGKVNCSLFETINSGPDSVLCSEDFINGDC